MKKQVLILFVKYGLGLGLLAWVVADYWHVSRNGKEVGLASRLAIPALVSPAIAVDARGQEIDPFVA